MRFQAASQHTGLGYQQCKSMFCSSHAKACATSTAPHLHAIACATSFLRQVCAQQPWWLLLCSAQARRTHYARHSDTVCCINVAAGSGLHRHWRSRHAGHGRRLCRRARVHLQQQPGCLLLRSCAHALPSSGRYSAGALAADARFAGAPASPCRSSLGASSAPALVQSTRQQGHARERCLSP